MIRHVAFQSLQGHKHFEEIQKSISPPSMTTLYWQDIRLFWEVLSLNSLNNFVSSILPLAVLPTISSEDEKWNRVTIILSCSDTRVANANASQSSAPPKKSTTTRWNARHEKLWEDLTFPLSIKTPTVQGAFSSTLLYNVS